MAEVIFHKTRSEFKAYNNDYLDTQFYSVQPVIEILKKADNKEVKIDTAFNIVDKFGSFILGLSFVNPHFIMLYGEHYTDEIIKDLGEMIIKDAMKVHVFSGTRKLILDLFKFHNMEYEVISDRFIYIAREVAPIENPTSGTLSIADMRDVEQLAQMSYDFSIEEYGDRVDHNLEHQRDFVIIPGIMNGNLYKWIDDGKICSIAQVVTHNDAPMLGHFFTPKEHRGKGYGSTFLNKLTERFLDEYEEINLISDATNPTTNKIFLKTGYIKISDWIKVYPKNSAEG
jgi:hypothetical protein